MSYIGNQSIYFLRKSSHCFLPSLKLLVQSDQWKQQGNVWNLSWLTIRHQVNAIDAALFCLLLILNIFHKLLWCFHQLIFIDNFEQLNGNKYWPLKEQLVGIKAKGRISKWVFQENKARQIFPKTDISYLLIQRVRNVRFSENLSCFVFLKYPLWDMLFCLIADELKRTLWVVLFFVMLEPAGIYLLKVENKHNKKRCKICSKLLIKTPKWQHSSHSGVFSINVEHISHLVLVFSPLTWSR